MSQSTTAPASRKSRQRNHSDKTPWKEAARQRFFEVTDTGCGECDSPVFFDMLTGCVGCCNQNHHDREAQRIVDRSEGREHLVKMLGYVHT